jgi:hypothetical protein
VKKFKLVFTENQIKSILLAIQEADDANSYQVDMGGSKRFESGYRGVLRTMDKLRSSLYKQINKQGWSK